MYANVHKVLPLIVVLCFLSFLTAVAQPATIPFEGEKTSWRAGFDRYDYLMDTATLAIKAIKATEAEAYGINGDVKGQVRCLVVLPKQPAAGQPWSWRGFYWDHEPQLEVELLKQGFAIGYINCDPGRQWEAWYAFLTEKHGWSKKPAFGGMSRGAINAYAWATMHPDQVSCIYGDNAAILPESLAKIGELAKRDIPLLSICGTEDFLYEKNTQAIENIYLQLGGRMTVMVKEGTAHHPHSLRNPKPIVDFVLKNTQPPAPFPAFADSQNYNRSYYYSTVETYTYLKEEDTYMTCRGPGFTPVYERYDVKNKSRFGVSTMSIVLPDQPAAGKPWVFRADRLDREALVDQALLAKGYAIVVAPITAQSGAVKEQWDEAYQLMTAAGFSEKVILEGTGVNAGETYAWAIENANKISAIYSINPVMRSLMIKTNPMDALPELAKAKVPLLIISGSLDPWLQSNTLEIQKRYKTLGQNARVILKKNEGHFLKPDPKEIIELLK